MCHIGLGTVGAEAKAPELGTQAEPGITDYGLLPDAGTVYKRAEASGASPSLPAQHQNERYRTRTQVIP